MFDIQKETIEWAGRPLTIETGRVARQADGAVMVTYGETTVLATAVGVKTAKEGQDFFPLTVNYQEKYFAAGKIPGGYFKREGRPTEKETLTSRLIDRPIRPLFAPGFKNEVQVMITVLSHDMENDPDVVGMATAAVYGMFALFSLVLSKLASALMRPPLCFCGVTIATFAGRSFLALFSLDLSKPEMRRIMGDRDGDRANIPLNLRWISTAAPNPRKNCQQAS